MGHEVETREDFFFYKKDFLQSDQVGSINELHNEVIALVEVRREISCFHPKLGSTHHFEEAEDAVELGEQHERDGRGLHAPRRLEQLREVGAAAAEHRARVAPDRPHVSNCCKTHFVPWTCHPFSFQLPPTIILRAKNTLISMSGKTVNRLHCQKGSTSAGGGAILMHCRTNLHLVRQPDGSLTALLCSGKHCTQSTFIKHYQLLNKLHRAARRFRRSTQ